MKWCRYCEQDKPTSDFHARKVSSDGLAYKCKSCAGAFGKVRYWATKDVVKARARAWARDNNERRREIRGRSRRKCLSKEKAREQRRALRLKKLEQERARGREQAKKFNRRNPDKVRAWRERARCRRMAENPERERAKRASTASKRRAIKRSAAAERVDYPAILKRDGRVCRWCRKRVSNKPRALHFDHVIPLSDGGSHSAANIVVSCAACNLAKAAKRVSLF